MTFLHLQQVSTGYFQAAYLYTIWSIPQ